MILAALALGLQATPAFMTDPAFNAAYLAWAGCTNRAVDAAAAGSNRREREIVAAAHMACTAEEAATRAAMIAVMGEQRGPRMMAELVRADRNVLADRVRERRRRNAGAGAGAAAAPDALIQVWARCLLPQVEAAAADAPEAQAVDAAFGACAAEADALRRYAHARGGADLAAQFIRQARAANREHLLARLREQRGRAGPAR